MWHNSWPTFSMTTLFRRYRWLFLPWLFFQVQHSLLYCICRCESVEATCVHVCIILLGFVQSESHRKRMVTGLHPFSVKYYYYNKLSTHKSRSLYAFEYTLKRYTGSKHFTMNMNWIWKSKKYIIINLDRKYITLNENIIIFINFIT